MGINSSAFKLILEECKKRPFKGIFARKSILFQNMEDTKSNLEEYELNYDSSLLSVSRTQEERENLLIFLVY